jgi:hypothetical protein
MNESLLQFFCIIFLCCESTKTIFIHVDDERVKGSDKDIDSHVIFVSIDEMRLLDVLGDHEAFCSFRYLLII